MAKRILRVAYEGTFGVIHETAKRTIDIIKHKDGEYYYKFIKMNELQKNVAVKKKVDSCKVEEILTMLSTITVPAFPRHDMGCDGGFTEIEVGDYGGKSHFRWWSMPPEGWEALDDVARKIIADADFENFY